LSGRSGRTGEVLRHTEIGELGERIATAYLCTQGRKVLYRNYRGPRGGELDIVARHGKVLTFVEVKTRTYESDYGRPLDAVNREKQEYIKRGADAWLKLLKSRDMLWRFDVVEVILLEGEKPKVNIVEEAF